MKTRILLSLLLCSNFVFNQCLLAPINLGNDTVLCANQSLTLTVPFNYTDLIWSTSDTSHTITINQSGTYDVLSTILGDNLLINGDFEQGNTGFTTQYVLGSVDGGGVVGLLTNVQTYEITTSPSLVHNNFNFCTHDGNMMFVNGATTPNIKLWCQTVTVEPSTIYHLTAELANCISNPAVPNIIFAVNNSPIGPIFSTTAIECDWTSFFGTWNSGINTSAEVCLVDVNLEAGGNDFAVDNITFSPFCTYADEIEVSYEQITYNLVDSLSFCADMQDTIIIETNETNLAYTWSTGELNDTIIPIENGYHFLTITSSNTCVYEDSVFVTIHSVPLANFETTQQNQELAFEFLITNTSTNANLFHWDFGNNEEITTPLTENQTAYYDKMGTYKIILIAENEHCDDTISKTIVLNEQIFIPDFFSPNEDTKNDYFAIKNLHKDEFEIQIINRWGNVVFSSNDIYFKWNGKDSSGKKCNEGTYFYSFFNYDSLGEKNFYQGYFQLNRD